MDKVKGFYDEFTAQQIQTGINPRHLSIQRLLEEFGLKPYHQVLEIGCGIGTVSERILRYLSSKGSLTATDISTKSLEIAKDRLSKYPNAAIFEFDFTTDKLPNKFDIIVLPDVLEHIPIELHKKLFSNLESMLSTEGFIFIHIPDPNSLSWTIRNNPDELQIIDQPIHTKVLTEGLNDTNLYISYLRSYSVYNEQFDYQAVQVSFIPNDASYKQKINFLHDSLIRRIRLKLKYYLRGRR